MNRRDFIAAGSSLGAALAVAPTSSISFSNLTNTLTPEPVRKFKLNYAPHFGMFKNHTGDDLVEQLKFFHAQGFTGVEDNWVGRRPIAEQELIGKTLADLKMTMGVFVTTVNFKDATFALASYKPEIREAILNDVKNGVEIAKRLNAKWSTIAPGCYDDKLDWDYQTASVIDTLKRCGEIAEKGGLTLVMEGLNTRRDHPRQFLTKTAQNYMICKAVGSPSVKVLYDFYHQQISEGNLIPNMDQAWDEIAYIQVGDTPGRKEPGTGEINYKNIFKHIYNKGYKGIVGMEHGIVDNKTKEGEAAAIHAYVQCDSF